MKISFNLKKTFLSFLLILFLFVSCKKENNPVDSTEDNITPGKIELGTPVDVVSTTLGSSGGKIKVSQADSPLNGMEITVPPNSLTSTKTFKVQYSEIKAHQFGSNFNPISPVISVTSDLGYSKDAMSVKIPIKLPAGHFAMGFLYDEKTGELEGMPIESLSNDFITVDTRTFNAASSQLGKRNGYLDASSTGKVIISSISETALTGQSVINSGFTPGVDDWEFVNYGSYIAPGGHCAGQSMTAMWYYYEKKLKGSAQLFHHYDEVNTKTDPALLWQDNPLGYRFASTIQEDFNWDGWVNDMDFRSNYPELVWKAFALSMLLTGEPQSVLIRNSQGQGGHAMIVYKINFAEGKLYIADPNYPNNYEASSKTQSIRTINFKNGKFDPYETGLTAGANSTTMDQISYFGKTAYIDWTQIGKRWAEVENKTIGNDRFPKYNLKVKNANDADLVDNAYTDNDTLIVYCKSNECAQYISGSDHCQVIWVYDDKGKFLAEGGVTQKGLAKLILKPGANKLAFHIMGAKSNKGTHYVDFKWITVNYQSLTIDPDPAEAEPGEEIKFTALSKGSAPKNNSKFVWSFGDNTPNVTKTNDSTVTHTYSTEGKFTVTVELFENSSGKKIMEASTTANITKESDLMKLLLAMNKVTVDCSFNFALNDGSDYGQGINVIAWSDAVIQWNGYSFTFLHKDEGTFDNNGFKTNYYETVTGTVSADTKTLTQIKYDYKAEYYRYHSLFETHTETMTFINVPQTRYPGYVEWGWGDTYENFRFELDKSAALSHVTAAEWKWVDPNSTDVKGKDKIKDFWAPLIIIFEKQ